MAIEKARLEQLIGQGAIIYGVNQFSNVDEIALNINYYVNTWNGNDDNPILKKKCDEYYSEYIDDTDVADIKDLFETKSEAEHYARFVNMVRTESLTLLSWEEWQNRKECVDFYKKSRLYRLCDDNNKIIIWEIYSEETIFEKPLTPENYTEACELVRKLWMGESECK